MRDQYFADEVIERIEKRIDALEPRLAMAGWSLSFIRQGFQSLVFDFTTPGMPEVEPTDRYLSINYAEVRAASVPTVVSCSDEDEAHYFLDRVAERLEQETPRLDYEAVLKAANGIIYDAYASEASDFTEDWNPDSLPVNNAEAPCWWDGHGFRDAKLVCTANWTYSCRYTDIPEPEGGIGILIDTESTGLGGEHEYGFNTDDFENTYGFPEGSLEEFLLLQLLCWRGYGPDHARSDNRAHVEGPEHAYIRYDWIAGLWLTPVASNVEYFERAIKNEQFKYLYDTYKHWGSNESDFDRMVWAWLLKARENAIAQEEDTEEIDQLRIKYGEPTIKEAIHETLD